jgi:uncharacterized membrane protein
VLALVLSIAGVVLAFCCVGIVLSVPGAILGRLEVQAIDAGRTDPAQRGTAQAAFVLGLIGVGLFVLMFGWWVVVAPFAPWFW